MDNRINSDLAPVQQARSIPGAARLTDGEAMALHQRWRLAGDLQAKDFLNRAQRDYAIAIALMYSRYGLPLSGMIVEGEQGALKAMSTFSAEGDRRLLTYVAYWIRLYILNHVLRTWRSLSLHPIASLPTVIRTLRRERARIAGLIGEHHYADLPSAGDARTWAIAQGLAEASTDPVPG